MLNLLVELTAIRWYQDWLLRTPMHILTYCWLVMSTIFPLLSACLTTTSGWLRSQEIDCNWSDDKFLGIGSSMSCHISPMVAVKKAHTWGLVVKSGNFLDLNSKFLIDLGPRGSVGPMVSVVGTPGSEGSLSSSNRKRSLIGAYKVHFCCLYIQFTWLLGRGTALPKKNSHSSILWWNLVLFDLIQMLELLSTTFAFMPNSGILENTITSQSTCFWSPCAIHIWSPIWCNILSTRVIYLDSLSPLPWWRCSNLYRSSGRVYLTEFALLSDF